MKQDATEVLVIGGGAAGMAAATAAAVPGRGPPPRTERRAGRGTESVYPSRVRPPQISGGADRSRICPSTVEGTGSIPRTCRPSLQRSQHCPTRTPRQGSQPGRGDADPSTGGGLGHRGARATVRKSDRPRTPSRRDLHRRSCSEVREYPRIPPGRRALILGSGDIGLIMHGASTWKGQRSSRSSN